MELSIVVCGWHFNNEDLYCELINEARQYDDLSAKYFIASHKSNEQINESFLNSVTQLGWNVLHFENEGWDWGAYQQFLVWQKDNDTLSDYYLFLHDDLEIKKHGFIKAFLEKIREGCIVVGNRGGGKTINLKQFYPEDVLWAEINGFAIKSQQCHVVRGSCVFTTKDVAENILIKMPIKKGINLTSGNSSLRVFAALVCDRFGEKAVGNIGDKPLSSIYINEGFRGRKKMSAKEKLVRLLHPYVNKTVLRRMAKKILRFGKVAPVKRGTGLRINLGCGTRYLDGYLNVDIDSPCADMEADILNINFEPNTVAEVLIVHVIEHIHYNDVAPLLKKIYTWLRPNGQLILEFPDIIRCCRLVLKKKNDAEELLHSYCGLMSLYGDPRKSVYQSHRWGWTGTTMVPLLKEIGFKEVYVERPDFHVSKRDVRIVGVK